MQRLANSVAPNAIAQMQRLKDTMASLAEMQRLEDTVVPIAEMQKKIAESILPTMQMQHQLIETMLPALEAQEKLAKKFENSIAPALEMQQRLLESVSFTLEMQQKFAKYFESAMSPAIEIQKSFLETLFHAQEMQQIYTKKAFWLPLTKEIEKMQNVELCCSINSKRIRDSAPNRKSIALTDEDLERATELERIFTEKYCVEAPFNFSKTISKALEIAYILQTMSNQQIETEK